MEYLTEEYYNTLPIAVQEILDQSEGDMDYELCKRQVKQLNAIGWDADYGLDGMITSVGKLDVNNLKTEVEKASEAIEKADEMVCDMLNKSKYASDEFKQSQRISNALFNIKSAIAALKDEL